MKGAFFMAITLADNIYNSDFKFATTSGNRPLEGLRAALYIRVSTDEQKLHGYSLEAQREQLTQYCRAAGMIIAGYYEDPGFSARKRYTSRKEFMRLLADVEADKIDVIVIIKLDRLFRSVRDYYAIQDALVAHNVDWLTTTEQYDTTTASGRFAINIKLAMAQEEADRTAERVRLVNDYKVTQGQVITGSCPLGYEIKDRRLVIVPDNAAIVYDAYRHYATHGNIIELRAHLLNTYGYTISDTQVLRMLRNTKYMGEYRGNPDYCPPIIDKALYDDVQRLLARHTYKPSSGRVYLFSGLLVCAECGRAMSGRTTPSNGTDILYYRCKQGIDRVSTACTHSKSIREDVLEDWLLNNILSIMECRIHHNEVDAKRQAEARAQIDTADIKRKLSRLKELYVNDMIDMDTYKADYDKYTAQLEAARRDLPPTPSIDLARVRALFGGDFRAAYTKLDKEHRRAVWRAGIQRIELDHDNKPHIIF